MDEILDYQTALHRFSGQTEVYEKFLATFPDDPNFEQLKQALQAQDYDAAFTAVHTIKGISGNLGLNRLFHAASALTEPLRNHRYDHLEPLWEGVDQAYCEAMEELKKPMTERNQSR